MLSDRNKDDFEKFLKQSADGLRMHPSEDSWTSISNRLRDRRRKTGITSGVFFLITTLLGYFLIQNKEVVKPVATRVATNTARSSISKSILRKATELSIASMPEAGDAAIRRESILETFAAPKLAVIRQIKVPVVGRPPVTQTPDAIEVSEVEGSITQAPAPSSATAVEPALITEMSLAIADSSGVPQEEISVPEISAPDAEATSITDKVDSEISLPADAVSKLNLKQKKNKLSFQVFFAPTVSYRKLSENKAYLNSVPQPNATINYAVLYNVNDAVTHKPDMGLELGFTAKYEVADNARVRAGLQFNISRYDIKAFTYPTEVAQIALNNSPSGINYVGTSTNYRNFGGGNANWLQNMYFQVSAPVGAEIRVARTRNASFGIAGTLQPTYILGDRAYLISTDYKNYTEVPWLMRRWNVNTSFETFVAYSTGKMNWQVGPQIRYQVLSSFVTEYPVRENLFDFGLKVGVSLNKNK